MTRRGRSLVGLLGIALAAIFLATPAWAQTGGIKVKVFEVLEDGSQDPLPGATVRLTEANGRIEPQVRMTDINGEALFPIVPVGSTYVLEVVMPGYAGVRLTDVKVISDQVQNIPVGLSPALNEVVNVTGETKVVELSTGTTSATAISEEAFADLPIFGREYQNALSLAAGVQDTDGDGNPNVHGSREQDFQMVAGGVSNVDPLTGERLSSINPDAIEEVEVIDSGADASFGGAIGGFGRLSYKTGGNEFEGSFTLYFRDSTFDNDAAGKRDPLDYQVFRPVLYFSGPIVKDKMWFVTTHELIRVDLPIDLIGGADFVQEQRGLTNLDQITWQVTPKDKLQLRYGSDPFRVEPAGVSSLIPPESGVTLEGGGPTVTLQWTNQFSGDFFFESLVAYQNIKNEFAPFERNVRNNCIPAGDPALTPLLESYCEDQSLFGAVSGTFPRTNQDRRRRWSYSLRGDKFISDWLGGPHRLTFGVNLERAKFVRDVSYNSQLLRQELSRFGSINNPQFPKDLVAETKFFPAFQSSESRGNFYAAYISDSYDIRQNLNLTVGVRLSREELGSDGFEPIDVAGERAQYDKAVADCIAAGGIPRICASRNLYIFTAHPLDNPDLYPTGCQAAPNPQACEDLRTARQGGPLHFRTPTRYTIDNYDIEPRISLAWDPWADGKTKIAGSWGRYVGNTFLAPLVAELGPDTLRVPFTINNRGQRTNNVPIQSAFTITEIDRDLKRQYSDEWTIRFEREIGPEMSVIGRYVNKKYRRQFQDIDVNRRPVYFDDLKNNKSLLFQSFPRCERVGEFADCTGDFTIVGVIGSPLGPPGAVIPLPDGFADVELVSPAANSVYLIGNFNESDYQAYIVELVRRFYQNWEMRASYTWSESLGQAEDFGSALGDDVTNSDDEIGPLATDQRHVFTLFGRVFVPRWGGFRIGSVLQYESGLPYSIVEQRNVADFPTQLTGLNVSTSDPQGLIRGYSQQRFLFPTHQRNDQRNSPFWTLNINFQKEFDIKDVRATVEFRVFNALNDDTLQIFQIRRTSLGTDPVTGERRFLETPVAIRRFGRQFELMLKANF